MLFLGISLEARRTRAVVFSLESNAVVGQGVAEHATEQKGGFPDPSEWIRSVHESVGQCLAEVGEERRRLAGISVSGQALGSVLLDAQNHLVRPLGPPAGERASDWVRHLGGRPGVLELTGTLPGPTASAAALWGLAHHEPQTMDQLSSVLQPHEFVNFWLTGAKRGECSGGSGTGLMDVRARAWCAEAMSAIDGRVGGFFPELHPSHEIAGALRPEIARAWGVADHLLVAAGGTRAAMSLLGSGAVNPGEVMVAMSSSDGVILPLDSPTVDPLGEVLLGCDASDQWMFSQSARQVGTLVDSLKSVWAWDNGQFESAAANASPGAGGLHYLLVEGRGTLLGMNDRNLTTENLARVAMESVALTMRDTLVRAAQLGVKPVRVRLVGGSGDPRGWRQILADVFGLPVASGSLYSSPEVGAALQAAVVFYHSSGENITYTEVSEYALPIGDEDWSYPSDQNQSGYQSLASEREGLARALAHGGGSGR